MLYPQTLKVDAADVLYSLENSLWQFQPYVVLVMEIEVNTANTRLIHERTLFTNAGDELQ